jgi:hypothetical protein
MQHINPQQFAAMTTRHYAMTTMSLLHKLFVYVEGKNLTSFATSGSWYGLVAQGTCVGSMFKDDSSASDYVTAKGKTTEQ